MDVIEQRGREQTEPPEVLGSRFYDARRLPRCNSAGSGDGSGGWRGSRGFSQYSSSGRYSHHQAAAIAAASTSGGSLDCIDLTSANPRFPVDINTSYSVVHVPRNVYSRGDVVLK
jgi:hypothetical protein